MVKSAGASVHSNTGSQGVRISGSNAGYTMFRSSVKSTCYSLHSPVSPSLPLPWVTVCHHISTGLYLQATGHILSPFSLQVKHYTSVLAAPRRKFEARYYRLPSSVTAWILVVFFLKTAVYFCAIFMSVVADSCVTVLSLAARVIFCDFLIGVFRSSQSFSACQWRHIGLLTKTHFV